MKRIRVDDLQKEWTKNPNYRHDYAALVEAFSLTAASWRLGPALASRKSRWLLA